MIRVNYGSITEMLMMPNEAEYITNVVKLLPENSHILEWGSGGSTFHWLHSNPTVSVTSIEHNQEWYRKVTDNLVTNYSSDIERTNIRYKPVLECGYAHGYGNPTEENPVGCDDYLNPNDPTWNALLSEEDEWNSDIYFIDGIARGVCALATRLKNRNKKARIFWHDYKGREYAYGWIKNFYSGMEYRGETLAELII